MNKFQNKYRIPSARLQSWNYGWDAAYFITICTKNREHLFGEIMVEKEGILSQKIMQLSPTGIIADVCWFEIKNHAKNVELGVFQVMPNHIHGIIILNGNNDNISTNNNENGDGRVDNGDGNGNNNDGNLNGNRNGDGNNDGNGVGYRNGDNNDNDGNGGNVGDNVGDNVETRHALSLQLYNHHNHHNRHHHHNHHNHNRHRNHHQPLGNNGFKIRVKIPYRPL
jgi:REP element-mobilizing transposase RayT